MENLTETETALVTSIDTSYLLLTGMNILVMQVGFTALEAGGSRAKNVKSLLFKNFMDHAVGSLAWFTIGWGLFVGSDPFAAGVDATFFVHPLEDYARIFQQFAFAATSTTIVSGAVTGRCRLEPYVVLSAFLCGISYPIVAHWAWSDGGWLRQLGFLDFAGSLVVHGFGGAVALVGAWACGPRPGRFAEVRKKSGTGSILGSTVPNTANSFSARATAVDEIAGNESEHASSSLTSFMSLKCRRPRMPLPSCTGYFRMPVVYKSRVVPKGHNPALMVLGALLLYFAWFSFNAGSSGSIYFAPDSAVRAAINTMLAPGAASLACLIFNKLAGARYDIEMACNSMLSGLVAITAGCGFIDPWAAVVIGFIATPVYILSAWFVLHVLGVDDVLGAVSVHGTCGILGTLWLGLAHPTEGLFFGAGPKLLGIQALGVLAIGAFAIITAYVFVILPYKCRGKLSYSQSEQLIGIDLMHFGGEFGKDVDLESDPRDRSIHSDRDDMDSDGNKSNNSNFVEEFPDPFTDGTTAGGGGSSTHGGGGKESSTHGGRTTPITSRSLQTLNPMAELNSSSRMVRSVSTNTFEGRRAVHSELKRVLDEDPKVRHRFRAYLEVMHREEGVAFWDEVLRWKSISSKKHADKKVKEAKRIIKTYCLDSGTKQVNLASSLVKKMVAALDDRDALLSNKLFDEAMEELFNDLKNSFLEFVEQTPNYWM